MNTVARAVTQSLTVSASGFARKQHGARAEQRSDRRRTGRGCETTVAHAAVRHLRAQFGPCAAPWHCSQVTVREHCALGFAGGAGGIEDDSDVVVVRRNRGEFRCGAGAGVRRNVPCPRASSVNVRCRAPWRARVRYQCARVAEHEPRLGVVQEILDLGLAVGGVERQDKSGWRAKTAEVRRTAPAAIFPFAPLRGRRVEPEAGRTGA